MASPITSFPAAAGRRRPPDAPGSAVRTIPALRGAILAYGPKDRMTRVASLGDNLPDGAWALSGERGLHVIRSLHRVAATGAASPGKAHAA